MYKYRIVLIAIKYKDDMGMRIFPSAHPGQIICWWFVNDSLFDIH